MPAGRPTKYKPEYAEELIKFFTTDLTKYDADGKEIGGILPTLAKFASDHDICVDDITDWVNRKNKAGKPKHPEFIRAYRRCKQLQENMLINNALRGHYQSNFAIFVAKNYSNMRDQTQTDVTSGGEKITGFIYNSPKHDTSNKSNDKAG
jgi:hypothetical protein